MLHLTIAALLTAAGLASAQNSTTTTECAEGLKMFVARGTGEEPGTGETGKLVEAIADEIEGSSIEAIEYPAQFLEVNYFLSVANGTEAVRAKIKSYAETCPGHKMALFGYSQGAQVVSNNLCGQPVIWGVAGGSLDGSATPRNLTEDIVAAVLLGDPTHSKESSYNRGTGKGSAIFYRNPDDNACEDLGSRIRSYCDSGDVFCDVGSDPVEEVHGQYIKNYQDELLEFVVDRFNSGNNTEDDSPQASSTPSPDRPGAASARVPALMVALGAPAFALTLM